MRVEYAARWSDASGRPQNAPASVLCVDGAVGVPATRHRAKVTLPPDAGNGRDDDAADSNGGGEAPSTTARERGVLEWTQLGARRLLVRGGGGSDGAGNAVANLELLFGVGPLF